MERIRLMPEKDEYERLEDVPGYDLARCREAFGLWWDALHGRPTLVEGERAVMQAHFKTFKAGWLAKRIVDKETTDDQG